MTAAGRERLRAWAPLAAVSAVAWVMLAVWPSEMAMPGLCAATPLGASPAAWAASLRLSLLIDPPARIAAGWALMLAAMMAPSLAAPVRHIRGRSLARRRPRSIALFLAGYGSVWMAAGALLLALAVALRLASGEPWVAWALALGLAVAWQVSPVKQLCLNRCHHLPRLPAFGWAAEAAALRFGLMHGAWCFGACWALMLVPLLVPGGHLLAMAAVAAWLCAERLERPMPARWAWRAPAKALRIVAAQARSLTGPAANSRLLPRPLS